VHVDFQEFDDGREGEVVAGRVQSNCRESKCNSSRDKVRLWFYYIHVIGLLI